MKNLILSLIFALVVLTGFSVAEAKASDKTEQTVLQNSSDSYVYVKVWAGDRYVYYVYTQDGLFVGVVEQIN